MKKKILNLGCGKDYRESFRIFPCAEIKCKLMVTK